MGATPTTPTIMRASYNGYYYRFPTCRCGFDSRYPLILSSMHYFYVLLLKNGNLYKGTTANLQRRIAEHKQGKVKSTKIKSPLLIHYEAYLLESDAKRREKFMKTTEGKRLLRQQIKDVLRKGSPSHSTGRGVG